jgi:hypothetical protein
MGAASWSAVRAGTAAGGTTAGAAAQPPATVPVESGKTAADIDASGAFRLTATDSTSGATIAVSTLD